MKSKIKIFESGISDGIMSRNNKFYPNKTQEEINKIFLNTRLNLGKKYGFDGKKMIQALQKTPTNNISYPDGTYVILNDKYFQKADYWYEQIPVDILLLEAKYKNIVIGNQMADCPVLIIEDRKLGVTALSHCGASYINRNLPKQTVQALIKSFQSKKENLYAYIGSCAKKDSYIYDKYPTWATSEDIWEKFIIEENGLYHIDLEGAIVKQLKEMGLTNIEVSNYDTITDDIHYSHSAAMKGNTAKDGQNFVGFYYF